MVVDTVLRTVKRIDKPMGNVQCLFCGDFRQLPAVLNPLIGNAGHYAFQHPDFCKMVPH